MPSRPLRGVLPLWKRSLSSPVAPRRPYGAATAEARQPANSHIERDLKATPVQLLRFALSETAYPPEVKPNDPKLDGYLDFVFSSPFLSRHHKAILPTSKFPAPFNLPTVDQYASLSDIALAIEKQVISLDDTLGMLEALPTIEEALSRCHGRVQYEEILTLVNSVLARAQTFKSTHNKDLILLGMSYASACSSPYALKRYVAQYIEGGHGSLSNEAATDVIKKLISGLRSRIWEDSTFLTTQLREVVAGLDVGGSDSPVNLHSILDISADTLESESVREYITLLGILGSMERLSALWAKILTTLGSDQTPGLLNAAVRCLEVFIEAGNAEKAVQAAREASQIFDLNVSLPITLWKSLLEHDTSGLLYDVPSQQTAELILQKELHLIETNLGAVWGGVQHIKAHDTMPTSKARDSGELKAYSELGVGEASTFTVTKRLLDMTVANGSSKHASTISTVANLLHEFEGAEIPLGVNDLLQQEYAWFPQSSSIEFTTGPKPPAAFDMTASWSTASLGLIRARPDCDGAPLRFGRHIHLMQLGYISARKATPVGQPNINDDERWTRTGHVIGWDRLNRCFMILWVGNGFGTINPGLLHPTLPATLPYLSAKVDMIESNGVSRLNMDSIRPLDNTRAYWLDLDPAFDLQP